MSKKCKQCRKIFKEGDFCLYCGGKLIEYIPKQEGTGSNSDPAASNQYTNQNSHHNPFDRVGKISSDSVVRGIIMNFKTIIAIIFLIVVCIILISCSGYYSQYAQNNIIIVLLLIAIVGEWTGLKDIVKGIFLK